MNALNIIAENYFEKFENHLRNIKVHNAFYRGFWEHIKKNGESIYVEISAMPLAYNNKNARLVLLNDITQKKIAEERIRQSEAHLAEAQRLAKLGSWNFDIKADRLTWSEELYNVFGTDKQTFIETHGSFLDLVDAEDREFALQTSRHTQQTGEPFTIEYHITTPKGEKRVIQEHGYGKTGTNGKVTHLFGTAQDITERKRAEEELIIANKELAFQNEEKEKRATELIIANKELAFQNEEKEKRATELIIANKELKKAGEELTEKEFFLRESQRAGNIGSYKVNFVTGYWQSSETLDGIFGIDKNYDRSIAGWMEIVHPDDRQNMDEYLRLEVIGKRKSFNKEYRIVINNDKQTRWVHGRGDVKFDDSSNVTNMIGTIQDITERKNGGRIT